MPPQLKRLIPLFVIFVGLFLLARHFLIPDSFGEYGFYRGLSLGENAAKEVSYSGKKACFECHDDMAASLAEDVHQGLSCEVCHGPGQGHSDAPDEVLPLKPSGRDFCLRCHAFNPAKPGKAIIQVKSEEHYTDQQCTECHNPHKPWDLKI